MKRFIMLVALTAMTGCGDKPPPPPATDAESIKAAEQEQKKAAEAERGAAKPK